jgi:hypothetical protein
MIGPQEITIYDRRQLRASIFTPAGAFMRSLKLRSASEFLKVGINDSTALVAHTGPDGIQPGTVNLVSGEVELPIARSDSFLRSFRTSEGGIDLGHIPTIGHWLGGFLVADGGQYRLAFYDWNGNLVRTIEHDVKPPYLTPDRVEVELDELRTGPMGGRWSESRWREEREKLLATPQRHFLHMVTPTIDAEGRLWILGEAGDSGYADLFGPDGFVGRLELPCKGFEQGWRVTGRWLALICAPDSDDFPGDAVFKLFAIEN